MLQILKNTAAIAAENSVFDQFVKLLENADGRQPGFLRVLTYHRVDEPARRPGLDPALLSATPKEFGKQMAYLASHYQLLDISDVLAAIRSRNRKDLPPRAVLVTFDDGYCDFQEHAWPILRRYKIPAALFVPTAYPDQPQQTFWWDDLYQALQNTSLKENLDTPIGMVSLANAESRIHAHQRLKKHMKTLKYTEAILRVRELCSRLGVQPEANCIMSWNTLRKLSQEGLTLGAHTRTHTLLNRIPADEARKEVVDSYEDLKREIDPAPPIFAYPGGEFNDDVVRMMECEGFSLAFTTKRGVNSIDNMHPLKIQRINVGRRTSLPILRAQLLSWTVHFSRLQSRLDP